MGGNGMTRNCARCGKRLGGAMYVYSRFTHARYCANVGSCAKRARRRKKAVA